MLGLSDSTAEYFRFKPSVNAWYVDGDEIEFKGMGIDPDSLKTGWGKIMEGESPEWVWDEKPGVKAPNPGQDFKRGFRLMVYLKDYGWREWTATTSGTKMGVENIWPQIHNGAASNQGKIAMVEYQGSKAVQIGKGGSRLPEFELKGWMDKPEAPQAPVQEVTPEPQPEPQPAPSDDDDWKF